MHRQGGLMRYHGPTVGPEAPPGKVVVEARHPVSEPEDAAVDAQPVGSADVVSLSLIGVAELPRLRRREVPALFGGGLEKPPSEFAPIGNHRHHPTEKLELCGSIRAETQDNL